MSRIHGRLAPSYIALIAAAALTTPALAATTTITVPAGTTQTTAINASPAAGDTIIVDVDGTLRGSNAAFYNSNIITGNGAGVVQIIVDGRIQGRFTFTNASGPITVNVNSGDDVLLEGWHTQGTTTFGSGADTINNTATGTIATRLTTTTFNFGAGADVFNNTGRLIVGGITSGTPVFDALGTLALSNLETFNNSGLIVLGANLEAADGGMVSDGQANDRLIANGVAYTGSGDSRIAFDVYLGSFDKADCSSQDVADCVDFTGGTTAGSTLLTINNGGRSRNSAGLFEFNPTPGTGGFNTGITLIVGASAAEHFILDPNSEGYIETTFGPMIEVGLVGYHMVYDAVGKRHMLVSALPSTTAAQTVTALAAGQDAWHSSTGSWFNRQADLRAAPGGLESSNGIWARLSTGQTKRETQVGAMNGDLVNDYVGDYDQRTSQLVFGADMLRTTSEDGGWVIGLMIGALRSDAEYDATNSELVYTGITGGVYGSFLAGPLFVDAVVNANVLDLEIEAPAAALGESDRLNSKIESIGAQLEGGWRIPVGADLTVEPLAAVSYVKSQLSDIPGNSDDSFFDFERATSLRAGAGLRGSYTSEFMGVTSLLSLTGRHWSESEGENSGRLVMAGGEATLTDEAPGSFTEVDVDLSLFNAAGLSGFVNLGGKVGDDYEAVDGSLGVRLRW